MYEYEKFITCPKKVSIKTALMKFIMQIKLDLPRCMYS